MDKAELQERFGRLKVFLGAWKGEETLAASPWSPGGRATGCHRFELVAGGTALAQTYHQQREGQLALSGHGVFTLDPQTGEVLWFWFDDFGFPPLSPARGDWTAEGLRLEKRTPRGETRYLFAPEASGWRQVTELRLGGQETFSPFLKASYRPA